jgi:hypothetical protein
MGRLLQVEGEPGRDYHENPEGRAMFLLLRMAIVAALWIHASQALAQRTADAAPQPGSPLKLLFVGNSLTYYNGMSTMVQVLLQTATGREVKVKEVTFPAARTERVLGLRETKDAIATEPWTFIVLQVQPGFDDPDRLYAAVMEHQESIRKAGARLVVYLPWQRLDRKADPERNASAARLAERLNGQLAPVAQAWALARAADPNMPLYDPDGLHPAAMGSYVAACVIHHVALGTAAGCPGATDYMRPENVPVVNQAVAGALAQVRAGK